jgi:hypothetical protein
MRQAEFTFERDAAVNSMTARRVIWQIGDGSTVVAPADGVAARYFAFHHPVPARRLVRRAQMRVSRAVGLVGGKRDRGEDQRPWWVDAGESSLGRSVLDWFEVTPSDPDGKTIGFLFAKGDKAPTIVAKVARTAASIARVERGHRALELLYGTNSDAPRLAPRPFGLARSADNDALASFEEAIEGRWLDAFLTIHSEATYLDALTDWLITLGIATRKETDAAPWSVFQETANRFERNAEGLVDAALLRDAMWTVRSLDHMPRVLEHHDCAPWNFYRARDRRLVAFDWDNATPDGIPGFDLIQALAYVGFAVDGAFGTRAFAESFTRRSGGRRQSILRACRERYASALGLDAATLRAIRLFAWMRLTNDEIEARRRANSSLRSHELERSMLGMWVAEARSTNDSY